MNDQPMQRKEVQGTLELVQTMAPIASFLRITYQTFMEETGRPGAWDLPPGTAGHATRHIELEGPAGPWPDGASEMPLRLTKFYMNAASVHIDNLGILFQNGGFLLSPEALVRTVLELTATAAWLLDPETSPRLRMARAYLDRLAAVQMALSPYKALWGSEAHRGAKSERDRIYDEARERFPIAEVTVDFGDSSYDWCVAGETLPRPTKLVEQLDGAEGVYGLLSGYSHPNDLELVRRMKPLHDAEGAPLGRVLMTDSDHLRKLAMIALASFHKAYGTLSAYCGWGPESFESWEHQYERALPGGISS